MKNKNVIKTIFIIFLIIFFISLISSPVFAGGFTTESLFENEKLKEVNNGVQGGSTDSGIIGGINMIIGLIQLAGTGVSLIMISFLGIKYIVASVEEKAEIKKTAMPILIGAVLLIAAVNIIAVVEKFTSQVVN